MNEIRTEITLEAPVERIWELFADTGLYPHWNTLFPQAAGTMEVGGEVELTVSLPGLAPFTIRPTMLAVEPGAGFSWQHSILSACIFSWRYGVDLEALPPGSLKLIQRSRFGGVLGPLFSLGMKRSVADGMAHLNQRLRRWGEKGNVQCLRC